MNSTQKSRYPHPPRPPRAFSGGPLWKLCEVDYLWGQLEREEGEPSRLRVKRDRLLRLREGLFEEEGDWVVLSGAGTWWLTESPTEYLVWENTKMGGELRREEGGFAWDPPIKRWLEDAKVEGWLAEAALFLADSPLGVDRLASAGILARLWGAEADHPGGIAPNASIRAWLRNQGDLSAAEDAALEEISCWNRLLERPFGAVRCLRHARDRLESTLYALRMARQGDRLKKALKELDLLVLSSASGLCFPDPDPDLQRWEDCWQEPEAWWINPP